MGRGRDSALGLPHVVRRTAPPHQRHPGGRQLSRLGHVYWIGGGSGAGKSTIAERIAAEHGLRYYSTDAAMGEHTARSTPENAPELHRFLTMDLDERWATRSPEVMLETFHWFRSEGFEHIVDDLLASPAPVVVEGFRLLPRLVAPLLADVNQAVWLVPTERFRRHAFETRGSTWHIANNTTDPPKALSNLLARDRMFTEQLAEEAEALHLNTIQVDLGTTEDELTAQVTRRWGLRCEGTRG